MSYETVRFHWKYKVTRLSIINEKYKDFRASERNQEISLKFFKEVEKMNEFYSELQDKCRTLRLAKIIKELTNMLREAESKGWIYYEFVNHILI